MKLRDIPFTYMWFLKKLMGNPKTVLDIGCGDGVLMETLFHKGWNITGIDIYKKSLDTAKKKHTYKKLIKGDIVGVCRKLASEKKKYDLVFCSQVIEHIDKSKGEKLLGLADKLAKKRIYFGTPRGYMNQPDEFIKGNPYQVHRSGWTIQDFVSRGYRVHGVGFLPIWSEHGLARGERKITSLFWSTISYLTSPLTFFVPQIASGMMAVKDL
jgi:SAM-dependent methyltransferase